MLKSKNWQIGIAVVVIGAVIIAVWLLVFSGDEEESNDSAPSELTTLTVSGSGGTSAILVAIAPAFEAAVPTYRLEVLTGTGTGGGVQGIIDGQLDVAAMARPLKDGEAIDYVEFGQSGQALYVHETLGDINLTSEQAAAIVFGEITNWAEVGGPDMEIVLYVRDESDSSTSAMRAAIFGDAPFSESAQVMTSQGDMIKAVEGIEGAIGFGTWPAVLAEGARVNPVSLDGLAPGDQDYPITGALGIGFLAERQADVQPLIDWLLSEQGQSALRELDVILG